MPSHCPGSTRRNCFAASFSVFLLGPFSFFWGGAGLWPSLGFLFVGSVSLLSLPCPKFIVTVLVESPRGLSFTPRSPLCREGRRVVFGARHKRSVSRARSFRKEHATWRTPRRARVWSCRCLNLYIGHITLPGTQEHMLIFVSSFFFVLL